MVESVDDVDVDEDDDDDGPPSLVGFVSEGTNNTAALSDPARSGKWTKPAIALPPQPVKKMWAPLERIQASTAIVRDSLDAKKTALLKSAGLRQQFNLTLDQADALFGDVSSIVEDLIAKLCVTPNASADFEAAVDAACTKLQARAAVVHKPTPDEMQRILAMETARRSLADEKKKVESAEKRASDVAVQQAAEEKEIAELEAAAAAKAAELDAKRKTVEAAEAAFAKSKAAAAELQRQVEIRRPQAVEAQRLRKIDHSKARDGALRKIAQLEGEIAEARRKLQQAQATTESLRNEATAVMAAAMAPVAPVAVAPAAVAPAPAAKASTARTATTATAGGSVAKPAAAAAAAAAALSPVQAMLASLSQDAPTDGAKCARCTGPAPLTMFECCHSLCVQCLEPMLANDGKCPDCGDLAAEVCGQRRGGSTITMHIRRTPGKAQADLELR